MVSSCRHASYEACMFGSESCWFIHDAKKDIKENEQNKNKNNTVEFFAKVLNMMEKMTQRIVTIENKDK